MKNPSHQHCLVDIRDTTKEYLFYVSDGETLRYIRFIQACAAAHLGQTPTTDTPTAQPSRSDSPMASTSSEVLEEKSLALLKTLKKSASSCVITLKLEGGEWRIQAFNGGPVLESSPLELPPQQHP